MVGRQDESGFGKIELRRQLAHGGIVHATRVFEYTEGIAGEGAGGEDVEKTECVGGHGLEGGCRGEEGQYFIATGRPRDAPSAARF